MDTLQNLEFAEFDNPKIKLKDGSRLIEKIKEMVNILFLRSLQQ